MNEWSNYDSVEGEMVSTHYVYVEAVRLDTAGHATGMAKIGHFDGDPALNGAAAIDPATPATFNFAGRWVETGDGIKVTLSQQPPADVPSFKWVGIFRLPTEVSLVAARLQGDTLHAEARYVGHPDHEDGVAVPVVYTRVSPREADG